MLRPQALYIAFRVVYLRDSFSGWHIAGLSLTSLVYAICYYVLARAAAPKYAPLEKGGALIDGGADMAQGMRAGPCETRAQPAAHRSKSNWKTRPASPM